jgi:hypothetical protein
MAAEVTQFNKILERGSLAVTGIVDKEKDNQEYPHRFLCHRRIVAVKSQATDL